MDENGNDIPCDNTIEGSFVKLKIAEKEERLKIDREKKTKKPQGIQNDGKYYLVRLEMEREKLKSLINEAESDQRLAQITEEACGKIRNAIGKAYLLINKKFKQFEELCRDNIEENPEERQNELEIKSSDLQGYWDMMFMQIDDVKALFSQIEKLKANNWKSLDSDIAPIRNGTTPSPTERIRSGDNSKEPSPKARKKKKSVVNDEKAKKEARRRMSAIRKQARLRQKEEQDTGSFIIQINGCNENGSTSTLNDIENGNTDILNNDKNGGIGMLNSDKNGGMAVLNNVEHSSNGLLMNNELIASKTGSLDLSFNTGTSFDSSLSSSSECLGDISSNDIINSSIITPLEVI